MFWLNSQKWAIPTCMNPSFALGSSVKGWMSSVPSLPVLQPDPSPSCLLAYSCTSCFKLKNKIVKSLYQELLWNCFCKGTKLQFVRSIRNSLEPNSDLKINVDSEENYSAQNSRAECSDSSGGDRPVSHEEWMVLVLSPMKSGWFLMPSSFCPWKGQPPCSPGALQSLCYARALEWENRF